MVCKYKSYRVFFCICNLCANLYTESKRRDNKYKGDLIMTRRRLAIKKAIACTGFITATVLGVSACGAPLSDVVGYNPTETGEGQSEKITEHHGYISRWIKSDEAKYIRSMEFRDDGSLLATLAPTKAGKDGRVMRLNMADIQPLDVKDDGADKDSVSWEQVGALTPPPKIDKAAKKAGKDSLRAKQINLGWSGTQLIGHNDTQGYFHSDDMWTVNGSVGVGGVHIGDEVEDTEKKKDKDEKEKPRSKDTPDIMPIAGGIPAIGLCAAPSSTLGEDNEAISESSRGTASIIAANGTPTMNIYDPTGLRMVDHITPQVGLDGSMIRAVDADKNNSKDKDNEDKESGDTGFNPSDEISGSLGSLGMVSGLTALSCMDSARMSDLGFAMTGHGGDAGKGTGVVAAYNSQVADAMIDEAEGDHSGDTPLARIPNSFKLLAFDASTGIVTDGVHIDTKGIKGINTNEVTSVAVDYSSNDKKLWVTYEDMDGIFEVTLTD